MVPPVAPARALIEVRIMPGDRSGVREAETTEVVLVVDDDDALRKIVVRELEYWGHVCAWADSAEAALVRFGELAVSIVVTDLHLPTMSGVDLIVRLRALSPMLPAVLMSGDLTPEARTRALAMGGVALIDKPFSMSDLRAILDGLGCRAAPSQADRR